MGIERLHLGAAAGKALLGSHPDAFVVAHMIDRLQPVGQPGIEFRQRARLLAGQAQQRLKVLLQGVEAALDFAFAPRRVRLGVEPAEAQIGANDAGRIVAEGAARIGVELARHPAPHAGLLEALGKLRGSALRS